MQAYDVDGNTTTYKVCNWQLHNRYSHNLLVSNKFKYRSYCEVCFVKSSLFVPGNNSIAFKEAIDVMHGWRAFILDRLVGDV